MNGEKTQSGVGLKKVILTAIVVAIVSMVFGSLTCGWLFSGVYEMEPVNVWKFTKETPPTGADMGLMLLGNFVLALIMVWIYGLIMKGIPGAGINKGINYGILVWLLSLGGMWAVLMFMTVNPGVVLYWTVIGLVAFIIKGSIIGAMIKE